MGIVVGSVVMCVGSIIQGFAVNGTFLLQPCGSTELTLYV
jgi:hypothetical protein